MDDLIDVETLMHRLGVSRKTIHTWMTAPNPAGRLPYLKLSRTLRFKVADVECWLNALAPQRGDIRVMDNLSFDLDMQVTKAEQNFKSFVSRMESELKKLQGSAEKAMSAPRSKQNADKDMERMKKQREDFRRHNEREADKVDAFNRRIREQRDRDVQRSFDKELQAAKNSSESIAAFRIRANAQLSSNDRLTADVRVRLQSQLAAELTTIEANRAGKSQRILQAELSAARSAHQRRVREFAAGMPTPGAGGPGSGGRGINSGKALSLAFGAQQAVEDFSYAGFRGASNNLAAMAATMGGASGVAALAALAGVAIAGMAKSMLGLETAGERANRELEQFVARSKELSDRRMESMSRIGTADLGAGPGAFQGKAAAAQQEAQRALAESIRAAEDQRKVERLAEAQRRMWLTTWSFGASDKERETSIDDFEKAAKAAGVDREVGKADIFGMGFGMDLVDTDKMLAEAAKHVQDLETQFGKASREARDFQQLADMAARVADEFERASKAAGELGRVRIRDRKDTAEDALSERHRKEETGLEAYKKQRSKALGLDAAKSQLSDLQNQYGMAREADDLPRMNQILQEIEAQYAAIAASQETLTGDAQKWADEHSEVLIALTQVVAKEREVRTEIEGQISATQRLIDADRERIEQLKESADDSRHSRGGGMFGARFGMLGREADDAVSKAEAQAAKFGGDASTRVAAIREKQRRDERKMLDDREKLLKERAESQDDVASDAADSGEFGKAEAWLKKQRETLDELRRMQLDQTSSRSLPEAKDALQRAQGTDTEIDRSFDKELEIAKQRQSQDEADMETLRSELQELDTIKSQLEDRQIISDADLKFADQMLEKMQEMLAIKTQIESTQGTAESQFGAAGAPGRAGGGPVTAGQPYMTGENGSELFVPSSNGRIFNATDTAGLMSQVVAAIRAGDHGGMAPSGAVSTTNFGTVNVTTQGIGTLDGMLVAAAMAAKNSRIRRS